jgi:hypothetical protein
LSSAFSNPPHEPTLVLAGVFREERLVRVNLVLWWVLAAFFAIVCATYVIWNFVSSNGTYIEPAGAVALGLCAVASTFLAFYLTRAERGQGGTLPEDRVDADIDDGDPEMGFYSPWSWWPVSLGLALSLMVLGIAVGTWLSFVAAPLVLVAIVGWVYEYYRKNFAR